MKIMTIAGRELRGLFFSPLAWVVLGLSQLLLAFLLLGRIEQFAEIQSQLAALPGAPGATQLVALPTLDNAVMLLLLIVPLLTMRSVSEERRSQVLPLLLASPVSLSEIVLGKFLGLALFLLLLVLLSAALPLSLLPATELDLGHLAAATLGLALLALAFAALGLWLSTLTAHPAVAAGATFVLLLLLWSLDLAVHDEARFLPMLSMARHHAPFAQGLIDSTALLYFGLVIATGLALAIHRLDRERLR